MWKWYNWRDMSKQDNQKKSDARYDAIDLRVRKLARQPRSVSRFYDLCGCIEDGAFIACRGSLDGNLDDQPWLWKCLDLLSENPKQEDLTSTSHADLDYAPTLRKMMTARFKKAAVALLMWAEKTGGREYAPVENCFPCRVVFELDCPRYAAEADLHEDGGGIWSRRAADTYEEILFNKRANGAIWTYRDESLFKVLRNYCRAPENDDYATSHLPQPKTATDDTLLINFVELDEEHPQDLEQSRANVVSEKLSRMKETFDFYAQVGYYQRNEANALSTRGEKIIRELHGEQHTPIRFSYLGLVEEIIETIYYARQLHEFYTGKRTSDHAVLLSDVLGHHTQDGISPRLQSFKMFCQTLGSVNILLNIDEYTDVDSWFKALLRILRRYIPGSECLDVQNAVFSWVESYDGLSDEEIDTRTYLPEVLKKLDAVIDSFEALSLAFYRREQDLLNGGNTTEDEDLTPPSRTGDNSADREASKRFVAKVAKQIIKSGMRGTYPAVVNYILKAKKGDRFYKACQDAIAEKERWGWADSSFLTFCKGQAKPTTKSIAKAGKAQVRAKKLAKELEGVGLDPI